MSRSSMLYALAGSAIVGGVALFVGSSRLSSLFQSQPKGSRVSRHVKVKTLIVEPIARNEEPVPALPTALDSTENAPTTSNTDATAPATHVETVAKAPLNPDTKQGAHKKDEARSKRSGKSSAKVSRKNADTEALERKRKASAAPEGQPSDPKHHHGTPPPKGEGAASATHDVAPATYDVMPAARTRARSIAMSCGEEAEKLAQEVIAGIEFQSNPLAVVPTAAATASATAPKTSDGEAAETRPARTRARSIAMSCGEEAEKLAQEVVAGIAYASNPLSAAATASSTAPKVSGKEAAETRPARTRARSIAMSCGDEAEKLAQEVVAGIAYASNPLAAAATASSTAAATAPKAQRKKKAERKAAGKHKAEVQTKADTTAEVARSARTRARSIAMSCGDEAEKIAQEVVAGIAYESNPLAAMVTASATAPQAQVNKRNERKKKSDDKKKSARKKKGDTTMAAVPAGRTRARSIAMSFGEEAEKLAQEVVAGIAYESNLLVAEATPLPEASVPTANDSPPTTGRARSKSLLMSIEPSSAPPITVWMEGPAKNAGTASSPCTTSVENPLLQTDGRNEGNPWTPPIIERRRSLAMSVGDVDDGMAYLKQLRQEMEAMKSESWGDQVDEMPKYAPLDSSEVPVPSALGELLQSVLEGLEMSPEARAVREQLIQKMSSLLQSDEVNFPAKWGTPVLQPFGSWISNMCTDSSDLDLCVQFMPVSGSSTPRGQRAGGPKVLTRNIQQEVVTTLNASLLRCPWASHVEKVVSARVPIVRFTAELPSAADVEGPQTMRVLCDVSADWQRGLFKSAALAHVAILDHRYLPLARLVKHWAKCHSMCDATKEQINTYCWVLLTITFLQTRVPPVLPPLSGLLSSSQDPASFKAKVQVARAQAGPSKNTASVEDLFAAFVMEMAQLTRQWASGKEAPKALPLLGQFAYKGDQNGKVVAEVEDPFEAVNCARGLSAAQSKHLAQATEQSAKALRSTKSKDELLSALFPDKRIDEDTAGELREMVRLACVERGLDMVRIEQQKSSSSSKRLWIVKVILPGSNKVLGSSGPKPAGRAKREALQQALQSLREDFPLHLWGKDAARGIADEDHMVGLESVVLPDGELMDKAGAAIEHGSELAKQSQRELLHQLSILCKLLDIPEGLVIKNKQVQHSNGWLVKVKKRNDTDTVEPITSAGPGPFSATLRLALKNAVQAMIGGDDRLLHAVESFPAGPPAGSRGPKPAKNSKWTTWKVRPVGTQDEHDDEIPAPEETVQASEAQRHQ